MIKVTQKKGLMVHWMKFVVVLLTRMKTTFCTYIGTQNSTYKISTENFRKSTNFFPHSFHCLQYIVTGCYFISNLSHSSIATT